MHAIKHHVRGIKMVLAMMPHLGIEIPKDLKEHAIPKMDIESNAFNLHRELNFFGALVDALDDPLIGLRLGRVYHLQSYGMYGLAILVAPDMRTVFHFIVEYSKLTYSLMNFSFDVGDKIALYQLTPSNLKLPQKLRIFYADRDISASVFAFETLTRQPLPYDHIGLVHDGQGRKQDYIDYFGCDIRFNATSNYCAVPVDILDAPLPFGQPDAFEKCKADCMKLMSQLVGGNDIIGQIRQEFDLRPGYLHDFQSIAAQLSMSERTLRRRLAELGTSYQEIQRDIRFQKSKEYLQNSSLMLQEIAELVGYTDAGTFCNAFKRWSGGMPPKQYRQQSKA